MSCRCSDMAVLSEKMSKLRAVLGKSATFSTNNSNAVERLSFAEGNSWSTTKSECVKNDVRVLPGMTDLIVNSHSKVVNAINKALKEMEEDYAELKAEDDVAEDCPNNQQNK